MKKYIVVILLISSYFSFSQEVKDFKKKTENNALERTEILDLLRTEIKKDINQDVQFVVKHLKVSGKYAWFEGEALRKDGKTIKFPDDSYECCNVGGLFEKKEGKWTTLESGTFSTDCWYCEITNQYPYVPKIIFSESVLNSK